jgi:aminoglycoside/choline kinase family phosphotransferase
MADLARLVFDWYAPGTASADAEDMTARLRDTLARTAPEPTVLSLRDFHAENLLWLPDRTGPARVGLLDFQDAVVAHPAYDLVSLLNDARRDVSEETRAATVRHFLDLTGHAEPPFAAASAALSVQRNLRILGVFARLARRDGKTGYLRFLPRVWRLLLRDLDHPALTDVRETALRLLPPPEAAIRESA